MKSRTISTAEHEISGDGATRPPMTSSHSHVTTCSPAPLAPRTSTARRPYGYVPKDGWTIAFGTRGCGKSWFTRHLALTLAADGDGYGTPVRVAWLDLEGGKAAVSYARRCALGLTDEQRERVSTNLLRYSAQQFAGPRGVASFKRRLEQDGGADFLIVDSMTALIQDDLSNHSAAANFAEMMRAIGVPAGLAVAHKAKDDKSTTTFGSQSFEAWARLVYRVTAASVEEWISAGGQAENDKSRDARDFAPADGGRPTFANVECSKTNGKTRVGDGAVIRVRDRGDLALLDTRPLTSESAEQKDESAREKWFDAVHDLLAGGREETKNQVFSATKELCSSSKPKCLRWIEDAVQRGDLVIRVGEKSGKRPAPHWVRLPEES